MPTSGLIVIGLLIGNTWWNLAVAVGLAFVLTQLGFIGHDAGHRQISSHRRSNDLIGLVHANLLAGFSFGWWMAKHNRHHAHTNRQDRDPDLAPGAIAYTPGHVEGRGQFGRLMARVQAVTLLPLMFLEALNMHIASAVALVRRRDRGAFVEVGLLIAHAALFFLAPFLVLSPIRAVTFIVVTQSLFGLYLGASFVTNHVGMPTLVGNDDLGFLRRQLLTSRNLRGSSFSGFVFGGLDTPDRTSPVPDDASGEPTAGEPPRSPVLCRSPHRLRRAESIDTYLDVFRRLSRIGRTSVPVA